MKRKIPTHSELVKKRQAIEEEELATKIAEDYEKIEKRKEAVHEFLYDKVLKTMFFSAVATEAMDHLKPTTHYVRAMKRDGERFSAHLEKLFDNQYTELYKIAPTFSTNMLKCIEGVIEKLCLVQFSEYPVLNKVLEEFLIDKENYKKNIVIHFDKIEEKIGK